MKENRISPATTHATVDLRTPAGEASSIGEMSVGEVFANAINKRWLTIDQVLREADVDSSGDLDLDEFTATCENTLRLPLTSEQIKEVFKLADTDNNGRNTAEQLKNAILASNLRIETKISDLAKKQENYPCEITKLVALVAHNNMKPAMLSFVAQHRDFFKSVQIVTTGSTGSSLEKKLKLKVAIKVASGPLGGDQEIGAMVTRGEVAAAFFFIDPLTSHPHSADIRALTRICEVHDIASATNSSTGAALVYAFLNNPEHKKTLRLDYHGVESKCVEAYKINQKKVIERVAQD